MQARILIFHLFFILCEARGNLMGLFFFSVFVPNLNSLYCDPMWGVQRATFTSKTLRFVLTNDPMMKSCNKDVIPHGPPPPENINTIVNVTPRTNKPHTHYNTTMLESIGAVACCLSVTRVPRACYHLNHS